MLDILSGKEVATKIHNGFQKKEAVTNLEKLISPIGGHVDMLPTPSCFLSLNNQPSFLSTFGIVTVRFKLADILVYSQQIQDQNELLQNGKIARKLDGLAACGE